jgi:Zn-dependent protease with chaperone function
MSEATMTPPGEAGILFDGQRADGESVWLDCGSAASSWQIHRADGSVEAHPSSSFQVTDDTDRMQRTFTLDDGRQLQLLAPRADVIHGRDASRIERWIRATRNGWFSALAVMLVPAFLLTLAIPSAVNLVAPRIPLAFEAKLGEAVLSSVTRSIFKPTQLSQETQQHITARFETLRHAANVPSARLVFVRGAHNAFALPGGIVAITDELVYLLGNDDRIAAVLAHELGHVAHRHSLRGVATHMLGTQVLTVAMSQDQLTSKVVDLVAANVLTAQYSQDAEREADRYACELLAKTKQSPVLLADSFENFSTLGKRYNVDMNSGSYTSSHPPTGERIEAARACAEQHGFAR